MFKQNEVSLFKVHSFKQSQTQNASSC
jgi:hypothetical protein